MRLYGELASWFHLITHPREYEDEADHLRLADAAGIGTATLLDEDNRAITEIALDAGFSELSNFVRALGFAAGVRRAG